MFGTRLINIVILKTWYVLPVLYILQLITNIDHRLQLPTRKKVYTSHTMDCIETYDDASDRW